MRFKFRILYQFQLTFLAVTEYKKNGAIQKGYSRRHSLAQRGGGSIQWSFRKTGTMGTLASQAETGVRVQAPEALLRGYHSKKNLEIVITKSCNVVHFGVLKRWERRSYAFPLEMTPSSTPTETSEFYCMLAQKYCPSSAPILIKT